MTRRISATAHRFRFGKVTVYLHHGSWWAYYCDEERTVRRGIAATRAEAEQVAAHIGRTVAIGRSGGQTARARRATQPKWERSKTPRQGCPAGRPRGRTSEAGV